MRRVLLAVLVAAAVAAGLAALASSSDKLPKCGAQLCKPDCSADVLCVSGAHVRTCADFCGGH
jgi:hypothetical protein